MTIPPPKEIVAAKVPIQTISQEASGEEVSSSSPLTCKIRMNGSSDNKLQRRQG